MILNPVASSVILTTIREKKGEQKMPFEAEAKSPFYPFPKVETRMQNAPTVDYSNYMNAQSEWAQAFIDLAQQSETDRAVELSGAAGDALKRIATQCGIR